MNIVFPIEQLKKDVEAQKLEFAEHLKTSSEPMDTTSLQLGALLFFAATLGYVPKPKDGTISYESMIKEPGYGVKGFISFNSKNMVGSLGFRDMVAIYNQTRISSNILYPQIKEAYAKRLLDRVTLQYVKSRKKAGSPAVKAQSNWVKFYGEFA